MGVVGVVSAGDRSSQLSWQPTFYVHSITAQQQQRPAKIMLALRVHAVGRSDVLRLALQVAILELCSRVVCRHAVT